MAILLDGVDGIVELSELRAGQTDHPEVLDSSKYKIAPRLDIIEGRDQLPSVWTDSFRKLADMLGVAAPVERVEKGSQVSAGDPDQSIVDLWIRISSSVD
jgi:hypothetical protein